MLAQTLVTAGIVLFALAIILRRLWKVVKGFKSRSSNPSMCGSGCSGCKTATLKSHPMVQLSVNSLTKADNR